MPDCRKITNLILLSQKKPIPKNKTIKLGLHQMWCSLCYKFKREVEFVW